MTQSGEFPVVAVVVTYNRRELLEGCLTSLEAQTHRPDLVVVVDNASTDDTADHLARRQWTVAHQILTMPRNYGGSMGFAVGLRAAATRGAESVWLMDDDAVAAPDALVVKRGLHGLDFAQNRVLNGGHALVVIQAVVVDQRGYTRTQGLQSLVGRGGGQQVGGLEAAALGVGYPGSDLVQPVHDVPVGLGLLGGNPGRQLTHAALVEDTSVVPELRRQLMVYQQLTYRGLHATSASRAGWILVCVRSPSRRLTAPVHVCRSAGLCGPARFRGQSTRNYAY